MRIKSFDQQASILVAQNLRRSSATIVAPRSIPLTALAAQRNRAIAAFQQNRRR